MKEFIFDEDQCCVNSNRIDVPEKVFKQLNDLKEKCRHPQMTLDFFKYTENPMK